MNKEDLLQRKAALQQRFDELVESKTNAEDEIKRLQGEYRLLEDLIGPVDSESDAKPQRLRKVIDDAQD